MQRYTNDTSKTTSLPAADGRLLQREFPTLDSTLVAAILNDTSNLERARETLRQLAQQTAVDDDQYQPCTSPREGINHSSASSERWSDTDWTTASLSSLQVSEQGPECTLEGAQVDKIKELSVMFPGIKPYTIRATLSRANDDIEKATDELLNHSFLNEDEEDGGGVKKGVDGFSDASTGTRKSRKQKRQNQENTPQGSAKQAPPAPQENKWDKAKTEVNYISSRLCLPQPLVTSTYHEHGGKMGQTVASLLKHHCPRGAISASEISTHLEELNTLLAEFGNEVNREELSALLLMCKDDHVAVFTLAEAMRRRTTTALHISKSWAVPSELKTKPMGLRNVTNDREWVVVGSPVSPTMRQLADVRLRSEEAVSLSTTYKADRNEAFAKAAAAYRRSKSQPLMGGAAAFYADLGKDYDARSKTYSNIAAERLVDENSSAFLLDLHGITVAQAVKIAKERTTQWWVNSKDETGRGAKPFRIVAGVGRHSKDNMPKVLPAVIRMLRNGLYNFSVDHGEILVFGVRSGQSKPV